MLNDEGIREILRTLVSHAATRGEKVIDVDAEIAKLQRKYPRSPMFDVNALRGEIAGFAQSHGLAVQMGSR
jgi:hypothetical protein